MSPLSRRPVKRSPKLFSLPLSNFSPCPLNLCESVTCPPLSRIFAFILDSREEEKEEAISIDTDERVKKKEGKKKMGKHLRTVDRVGALKAHTGRVTGRCFRLIAGSTID